MQTKKRFFFVKHFLSSKAFFEVRGIPSTTTGLRFSEGKLTWYPFPAFFCLFLPFSKKKDEKG